MTETAEKWTSFPITYKYIDVSTAHITKEDGELLMACMGNTFPEGAPDQGDIAPMGYNFDYGHWIFVGLGSDWGTVAQRDGSRFSPSFINLYQRAAHSDADWMKIDCDGMIYDDLPKYVW